MTTCWDQCLEETTVLGNGSDTMNEISDDNEELELRDLIPGNREGIASSTRNDVLLSASAPVPSNLDSDLVQLQERLHLGNNVRSFKV